MAVVNAVSQLDDQIDTYSWLLAPGTRCPACGADSTPGAPKCARCGRSLMRLYRPPQRSTTTRALVGAWLIGLFGTVLALIGALFQVFGVIERSNSPQILRALLIGCTILGLFCALMVWGCFNRRAFALLIGIALAIGLGVAGIIGGLRLKGPPGLAVATLAMLVAGALSLMHLAVVREFRGEWRPERFAITASSGKGLFREGRANADAGLHFLAAQCWARAIGKEPGNAEYMHALGLSLARLGQYQRALDQLERAARLDPTNPHLRQSCALVRQQLDVHP